MWGKNRRIYTGQSIIRVTWVMAFGAITYAAGYERRFSRIGISIIPTLNSGPSSTLAALTEPKESVLDRK